jgi:hypothetical protein
MASRDGLDAAVLDPRGYRRSLRQIALETAAALGAEEAARIAREGNGAERQRRTFAGGSMGLLLAELVRSTSEL